MCGTWYPVATTWPHHVHTSHPVFNSCPHCCRAVLHYQPSSLSLIICVTTTCGSRDHGNTWQPGRVTWLPGKWHVGRQSARGCPTAPAAAAQWASVYIREVGCCVCVGVGVVFSWNVLKLHGHSYMPKLVDCFCCSIVWFSRISREYHNYYLHCHFNHCCYVELSSRDLDSRYWWKFSFLTHVGFIWQIAGIHFQVSLYFVFKFSVFSLISTAELSPTNLGFAYSSVITVYIPSKLIPSFT